MRIEVTDEYLYNIMPKVADLMIKDIQDDPELPFEPSAQFEKKIKKLIRKSKHPKLYRAMSRKLSKVAVFALLIVGIGAALAVIAQATEELRMKIKERIVQEDAVIEYFDVSGQGYVKHLTYIPEGYELVKENPDVYMAEYKNAEGDEITYDAWILDDSTMIQRDIEFIAEKEMSIRNHNIYFGYKENGKVQVSWYEDNVFYLICILAQHGGYRKLDTYICQNCKKGIFEF